MRAKKNERGGGGGEGRKRLHTNPSILNTCVRQRTRELIGSASRTILSCVDQRFASYWEVIYGTWHARCDCCLGGVYMRKLAPPRVSYQDDFLISYRVYIMTGSFHISLFEGTLHVDKIHVWFKIANITHALLVPVYRQTDFPPERVDVSRLHDTVAKSRTRVKFSLRCDNRGELAPGRLAPAWHFTVVSCKQM